MAAKKYVLIIDDDSDVRSIFSRYVSKAGYFVIEASNATTAINTARSMSLHLIVADIMLPDMNGIELANYLHKKMPQIPVIAVSALDLHNQKKALTNAGVKAILKKPVDKDLFTDTIKRHIL